MQKFTEKKLEAKEKEFLKPEGKGEKTEVKEKHEKDKHEREKCAKDEVKESKEREDKQNQEKLSKDGSDKQNKEKAEKEKCEQPEDFGLSLSADPTAQALESRLSRIEAAVNELHKHFIKPENRPDLSQGALTHEEDVQPGQDQG